MVGTLDQFQTLSLGPRVQIQARSISRIRRSVLTTRRSRDLVHLHCQSPDQSGPPCFSSLLAVRYDSSHCSNPLDPNQLISAFALGRSRACFSAVATCQELATSTSQHGVMDRALARPCTAVRFPHHHAELSAMTAFSTPSLPQRAISRRAQGLATPC